MALPPAFLDELRARTPLAPLIGRKARLVRNGRQWKGCCPFHNEKTPSFHVYDDHFHCFGCGAHGDAITFLMRAEGASFPEAVERLAAEAGLEVPKPSPQAAARERQARDLHGVLTAAEAAFRRRLALPEGRAALDYLRRRGLSEATIARFGLGWSGEGRGALAADLKAEGIETPQLVEAGLMKWRDPEEPGAGAVDLFFNRVMFPIRDRRGRVISFGGRILGDGQPKYVNGPETPLFQKRRSLYGLDLAREGAFRGAAVVVVEGYMDVIALHQAGFAGALAPLGTALTAEQLEALWQLGPEPVLCFDGDAAGYRAIKKAAENSAAYLDSERTIRSIILPAGEDPDTFIQSFGKESFSSLLKKSLSLEDAYFEAAKRGHDTSSSFGKAKLLRELEDFCSSIKDSLLARELRNALRSLFFSEFRKKFPTKLPGKQHQASRKINTEYMRSGAMMMIIMDEPHLLSAFEEEFGLLPMNEDQAYLRRIVIDWWSICTDVSKEELHNHILGFGEARALAVFKQETINYKHLDKRYASESPSYHDVWQHLRQINFTTAIDLEVRALVQEFGSEKNKERQRTIANRIVRLKQDLDAILQKGN